MKFALGVSVFSVVMFLYGAVQSKRIERDEDTYFGCMSPEVNPKSCVIDYR